MKLITLLTDFGTQDAYTGALKGRLYREIGEELTIVDISHDVPMGDSLKAAQLCKAYWYQFPEGTIHIHGLTPRDGAYAHVAFSEGGHYFIGTDIGQYSLLFPDKTGTVADVSHLPGGEGSSPAINLFTRLAALIFSGKTPESWDIPQESLLIQRSPLPTNEGGRLQGNVIFVDHYGNAHTNIHRQMIESVMGATSFRVFAGSRRNQIERISSRYTEVAAGDLVAVYNQEGYLELAQSRGDYNRFVGVGVMDVVIVEPV